MVACPAISGVCLKVDACTVAGGVGARISRLRHTRAGGTREAAPAAGGVAAVPVAAGAVGASHRRGLVEAAVSIHGAAHQGGGARAYASIGLANGIGGAHALGGTCRSGARSMNVAGRGGAPLAVRAAGLKVACCTLSRVGLAGDRRAARAVTCASQAAAPGFAGSSVCANAPCAGATTCPHTPACGAAGSRETADPRSPSGGRTVSSGGAGSGAARAAAFGRTAGTRVGRG